MDLLILFIGLGGVWWGTELAVRGALRIAESFGLSQTFVGMTILAIGTDVPELFMAIVASVQRLQGTDASGVVLGSAVGSCLGQIGLVLGIAGLTGYLTLGARRIWTEGIMLLGSIALFALVVLDGEVTQVEGAILLISYAIYFVTLVRREHSTSDELFPKPSGWQEFGLCALGLTMVTGFSYAVITSAVSLAESWGQGQTVIGLLIVGLGTSLPELSVSLTAVRRKAGALSVGNILGSNIFDMLVPVGFAGLIAGIDATSQYLLPVDIPVLTLLSLMAFYFFTKKRGLQRIEAFGLLAVYVIYAAVRAGLA